MTKNSTIKRILIMVTTILSITMFSLLAVVAVSSSIKKTYVYSASVYNFNKGSITSDSYDSYEISDVTGLKNFASSINII